MKKQNLNKTFFLLAMFFTGAVYSFSQQACSKPKVYVSVAYPDDPFLRRQIYEDYSVKGYQMPFDEEKEYLKAIMDNVVRELKVRSSDVEIIPVQEKIFIDDKPETPEVENDFEQHPSGEYHLRYFLGLKARDQKTPGPDGTIHPAYWSIASIGDGNIDGRYVNVASYEYPDLFGSISNAINRLCNENLRSVLDKYEATHFNALREGSIEMEVLSPGYVSPEPEYQKITIRVSTKDCRDHSGEGTNLFFPADKDRGTFTPVQNSAQYKAGNTWQAKTLKNGGITIEYC